MNRRVIASVVFALLFTLGTQPVDAREQTIWERLQGTSPTGYVLLMRHALAPGVGDPENFTVNDCSTQRNLSDEGRAQAQEIGRWLKSTRIKVLRVESSRWCRAKETAKLLGMGKVKLNKNLDSLFEEVDVVNHPQTLQTRRDILAHRNKRGLLVMVGHYVNIAALTGVGVDSGSGVIVRADRKGNIKVFGKMPIID